MEEGRGGDEREDQGRFLLRWRIVKSTTKTMASRTLSDLNLGVSITRDRLRLGGQQLRAQQQRRPTLLLDPSKDSPSHLQLPLPTTTKKIFTSPSPTRSPARSLPSATLPLLLRASNPTELLLSSRQLSRSSPPSPPRDPPSSSPPPPPPPPRPNQSLQTIKVNQQAPLLTSSWENFSVKEDPESFGKSSTLKPKNVSTLLRLLKSFLLAPTPPTLPTQLLNESPKKSRSGPPSPARTLTWSLSSRTTRPLTLPTSSCPSCPTARCSTTSRGTGSTIEEGQRPGSG